MNLIEYLLELNHLVTSRSDVCTLWWKDKFSRDETQLTLRARVQFHDDSFLEFGETIVLQRKTLVKFHYSYHYHRGEQLIFRYDNAPHLPQLPGFPHHKHIGDRIEGCEPPDLANVLKEIDTILYGDR